jgi:hypothetical protein
MSVDIANYFPKPTEPETRSTVEVHDRYRMIREEIAQKGYTRRSSSFLQFFHVPPRFSTSTLCFHPLRLCYMFASSMRCRLGEFSELWTRRMVRQKIRDVSSVLGPPHLQGSVMGTTVNDERSADFG